MTEAKILPIIANLTFAVSYKRFYKNKKLHKRLLLTFY